MLKKLRLLRNYLAYQIFFSFILIIALILGFAMFVPFFDARSFNPIKEDSRTYFSSESLSIQNEYNLDEIFERSLYVSSKNGFDIILLEKDTGEITGITEKQLNLLQVFIEKANNPQLPLQRLFGNLEFYGPFELNTENHIFYQYFIQAVSPQKEFLNKLFDSPWVMLIMMLIVSIPIVLWQSHRIAKPVKQLSMMANAVASGNLTENPKLETESIIELRQVGTRFNQMIYSLQRLQSYQQRLISDISHELKTPLTRMQLAVSLLRRRNGESKEISRLENEIMKLDGMIQDLLQLSRNNLNQHINREIFPINHIWEDILDDAEFELESNGYQLIVEQKIKHPEQYHINGKLSLVSSAVENVLRNATKYTKSKVRLETFLDEANQLTIIIDDDGNGVPEDQYQEIFRPFHRVHDDRARQTGGTGLGLAIVANAVENHHGTVIAEKSPFGGLRVKICLPLWLD